MKKIRLAGQSARAAVIGDDRLSLFFGTWCIYLSRICHGFIAVCVIGGSKVFAGVLFFYQAFAGL